MSDEEALYNTANLNVCRLSPEHARLCHELIIVDVKGCRGYGLRCKVYYVLHKVYGVRIQLLIKFYSKLINHSIDCKLHCEING